MRDNFKTLHKNLDREKCSTLFALADKLGPRCKVWAKHYRLEVVVKCLNGDGNASPLRGIGEYLVIFFVTNNCFGEYRFMLAGVPLRVLM